MRATIGVSTGPLWNGHVDSVSDDGIQAENNIG